MTALTAVGAFIRLPLPGLPIPITLQTLCCLLAGVTLGPRWGALSQAIYVFMGLLGLPVFTEGGGFAYILKPSFGFLLGLIPAAYIMGLWRRGRAETWRLTLFGLLATASLYLIGLPYLFCIMRFYLHQNITFGTVFMTGCLCFLPGDALKLIAATLIGRRLPVGK